MESLQDAAPHRAGVHGPRKALFNLESSHQCVSTIAVTQCEFHFPSGTTLRSITNTQGSVTYANDAFVAVSGYVREELEGQPHNLVRHPDMPS